MKDERKTKKVLIDELAGLRQRVAELEVRLTEHPAEDTLRESEARYWDLYENAPIAFFSVGVDGLIQRCNRRAGKLLGCPAEELVGKPVFELYTDSPQGREKASKSFQQFLDGDRISGEELLMQKADGTSVWISLTVNAIRDADGQIVESRSMVVDITERKQVEEALGIAKERYDMATSAGKTGVWDLNIQTGEFYLDSSVKALLGYADEEIPTDIEIWMAHIHPDDREPVMEAARLHLEGRTPEYVYEHRVLHKDGSVRWFLTQGSAIRDAKGKALRFVGTDIDITELKLAQEKIRGSERHLCTLMEQAPVGIITIDMEGNIIDANPASLELLGSPNREATLSLNVLTLPTLIESGLNEQFRHVIQTGETREVETKYTSLWGKQSFFHTQLVAQHNSQGKQIGVIQILEDITERKQAEETMHRRAEELATLNHISRTLSTVTELAAAMEIVAEIVTDLFNTSATFITILENDLMKVLVQFGHEKIFPDTPGQVFPFLNDPAIRKALDLGQSHVLHDVQTNHPPYTLLERTRARNIDSVMMIPLRVRGATIGIMGVGTDQASRVFTAAELSLVETISSDISGAINNFWLYEQAKASREQLATLVKAIRMVSASSLEPEQVYTATHSATSWLMPADSFAISIIDQATQEVVDIYVADRAGQRHVKRYPLQDTFAEYMLKRKQSARIDNFRALSQDDFPLKQFADSKERQSGMATLLKGSEKVLGILSVQSNEKETYTDEDQEILELLASHTAIALENAQRYIRAPAIAVSEERQRLARELHDSVTQSLYSLTLLSSGWGMMFEQGHLEDPVDSFNQLEDIGQQALKEMRLLIHQLRPPILEKVGLVGALQQRLETVEERVGVETNLVIEGKADDLPYRIEEQLFYIAQEAINNTLRHANAKTITVCIRVDEDRFALSIEDDGIGFDSNTVSSGMGSVTMQERAESIGGRIWVTSKPQQGTTVSVTIATAPP